ncbi:chorismate-binding protein [Halobacteriovorax sp. HFRX-2_2]|uniref:chorismate-binding protein n=1 Tax=unclassified Halobacteriovorax TaxID=2639665 RepID=UPI00372359C9
MHKTMEEVKQSAYAIFKHKEGFLKLERPSKYLHITNKKIYDRLNETEQDFSVAALKELLGHSWHVQSLHYELGHYFLLEAPRFEGEVSLATLINFELNQFIGPSKRCKKPTAIIEKIIIEEDYEKLFKTTFENLLAGNCYQLNLTSLIEVKISNSDDLVNTFLSKELFSKLSEFAHILNFPFEDRLVISNSPECLYEYDQATKKLITRPIKGTVAQELGEDFLINDIKNTSELNIITDLLRHDLSAIGKNFSKVESLREFFRVPGLIHQYSKISVELEECNTLALVASLFPGGSITGAPKKRVVELIKEIENKDRGIYTGSTILNFDTISKASINIRSLDVASSSNRALYGAGGGITLLSDAQSEFQELKAKANSFLKVFFKDVKI